jgi:hypothetical protein
MSMANPAAGKGTAATRSSLACHAHPAPVITRIAAPVVFRRFPASAQRPQATAKRLVKTRT